MEFCGRRLELLEVQTHSIGEGGGGGGGLLYSRVRIGNLDVCLQRALWFPDCQVFNSCPEAH